MSLVLVSSVVSIEVGGRLLIMYGARASIRVVNRLAGIIVVLLFVSTIVTDR